MRLLVVILLILQASQLSLSASCSNEEMQECGSCKNSGCVAHNGNVIKTVPGVWTVEECQDLCRNESSCTYLTFFEKEAFPLKNFCYLFSSCEMQNDCSDCVTEAMDCLCSSSSIGTIDNTNFLKDLLDANSERDCQRACAKTDDCQFYTYLSDQLQCILLSHLIQPLINCEYCRTGPVDCSATPSTTTQTTTTTTTSTTSTTSTTTAYTPPCKLVLPSGEDTTHHKFEAPDGTIDITIRGQTGCQLRALVVGGGGKWDYCGGGSGYLNYTVLPLENHTYKISVTAGGAGQSLLIFINGSNITANPGQDAYCCVYENGKWEWCGGNGYSGGGGFCGGGKSNWSNCSSNYYNGGTNGSNGGGPSTPVVINDHMLAVHGNGTGEDIRGYHMDKFKLSPGQGGEESFVVAYEVTGGGGGGVLVDGAGPPTDGNTGQGYGAGGGAIGNGGGFPGVVLIEIHG